MADQDLKLNVTATATGDGLRKTAEEVKNLNAETAKSAPIALEVKSREEQLAAVRERHAEAARKQAEAEAHLDAKRAASPIFGTPAGGAADVGAAVAGAGGAGAGGVGLGAMTGVIAGQMINEIPRAIQAAIDLAEEQRITLQKQSAELAKQVQQWGSMVAAADSLSDRIKLQVSMHERAAELVEKAAQAPVAKGSGLGGMLDNLLDNLKGLGNLLQTGMGDEGVSFEYSFEKKEKEAAEEAARQAKIRRTQDAKMVEQHAAREKELTDRSKLSIDERFEAEMLEIGKLETRRDEALANQQVRVAAETQGQIDAAQKRLREVEREADERRKIEQQATQDFNALQEKAAADERAREVAAEEARGASMAAEFDREEKQKQDDASERKRMEENNARALERVEREARQEAARDAREAARYAPASGGTTFADAPKADIHASPSASFQSLRKSLPAVPDISASQDEVVRAMRAFSELMLRQQRTNIEVARSVNAVTSQSYDRS